MQNTDAPQDRILQLVSTDPIVWRDQLQSVLGVSSDTIRRWLKSNRLPKPDIYPTRCTMGWKLSTFRTAGFDIAAAPTPLQDRAGQGK